MPLIRVVAIVLIVASGCTNDHDPLCGSDKQLRGSHISNWRYGKLKITSFPNGEESFIEHPDQFNYGPYLALGPPGKLFGSVGGVVSGNSSITEIDMTTGIMEIVRDGSMPVWEPITGSLAFWDGPTGKSSDQRLFLADRRSSEPPTQICAVPASVEFADGTDHYFLSAPVVLGNGSLAFFNERRQLCTFDATTKKLTETEFIDCWPQAARGNGRSLFCTDIHSWNVFEIDLFAHSKTELPGMSGTQYVFLEENNSLLFSTLEGFLLPIPHEKSLTKVYSIDDQTSCTLETPISVRGGIVWLPS